MSTYFTKNRTAGESAIVSGILGIMAYGFLITAVTSRTTITLSPFVNFMFRAHDIALILQFLLMMPALLAVYQLSRQHHLDIARRLLFFGLGSLAFTILILLLVFVKIVHDDYYPVAQGAFGVFFILFNWKLTGVISKGLRWFGMTTGLGLVLLGLCPVGIAIFVSPIAFYIPAVDFGNNPPVDNTANVLIHQLIWIGTFMGVVPLPFWTILIGVRVLKVCKPALQPRL